MRIRWYSLVLFFLLAAILAASTATPVMASAPAARGKTGSLTQVEIDGLLFMREEEKLAHDVYVMMYAKWGMAIFSNISSAESNHMAAIKTLLDRYGLPDPARGNGTGVFQNADLQNLYNTLIARGNTSLAEALKVGGLIEEVDINDLETRLALTNHSDITNVYNNLVAGSCNHLRAFVSTLQRKTGEIYQPQVLSSEVYQAIINGTY